MIASVYEQLDVALGEACHALFVWSVIACMGGKYEDTTSSADNGEGAPGPPAAVSS